MNCHFYSSESSQSSRTLVRRHSVVGVPVQRREIVIPGKGKSDKTRKKVGSVGKRSGKKSSKIKKPVTPVKKVRRNLFEGNASKSSPKKQSKTGSSSKSGRGTLARRHSIAGNLREMTWKREVNKFGMGAHRGEEGRGL